MKLSKFFMFGFALIALALTSCSGEDGSDGIDGIDGVNGNTGPAGEDGDDGDTGPAGADGNANVTHLSFQFSDGEYDGNSTINLPVEELTAEVLAEDTVLYYLVRDFGNNPSYYAIPGFGVASAYAIGVFAQTGTANFSFRNFDGTVYQLDNSEFTGAKVVIIESSNQDASKSITSLKSAGIDINDYNAVAKHFNLQ